MLELIEHKGGLKALTEGMPAMRALIYVATEWEEGREKVLEHVDTVCVYWEASKQ